MVTKTDFFEDIAVALDSWTATGTSAVTNAAENLQWTDDTEPYRLLQKAFEDSGVGPETVRKVFSECLRGFAVSILTGLDGGTALAEKGRIYVVDGNGEKLGEGLHNEFVGHLIDTGRL